MSSRVVRIAVINDSAPILKLYQDILSRQGYAVSLHTYGLEDLDEIKKAKPDLIISDHSLNQEDEAWEFIQKIRMSEETILTPIVLCTLNMALIEEAVTHLQRQKIVVVHKPFIVSDLLKAINTLTLQELKATPSFEQGTQTNPDLLI
jgi:DNA-binding response OmpR family regulator